MLIVPEFHMMTTYHSFLPSCIIIFLKRLKLNCPSIVGQRAKLGEFWDMRVIAGNVDVLPLLHDICMTGGASDGHA